MKKAHTTKDHTTAAVNTKRQHFLLGQQTPHHEHNVPFEDIIKLQHLSFVISKIIQSFRTLSLICCHADHVAYCFIFPVNKLIFNR